MNSFKKNKTYHIGLVDADLLCNGTRHPNLALLKIAGYLRDNGYTLKSSESDFEGNTYELLTNECNFEKLQELDHIYISCVFSFTLDNPPCCWKVYCQIKDLPTKFTWEELEAMEMFM